MSENVGIYINHNKFFKYLNGQCNNLQVPKQTIYYYQNFIKNAINYFFLFKAEINILFLSKIYVNAALVLETLQLAWPINILLLCFKNEVYIQSHLSSINKYIYHFSNWQVIMGCTTSTTKKPIQTLSSILEQIETIITHIDQRLKTFSLKPNQNLNKEQNQSQIHQADRLIESINEKLRSVQEKSQCSNQQTKAVETLKIKIKELQGKIKQEKQKAKPQDTDKSKNVVIALQQQQKIAQKKQKLESQEITKKTDNTVENPQKPSQQQGEEEFWPQGYDLLNSMTPKYRLAEIKKKNNSSKNYK